MAEITLKGDAVKRQLELGHSAYIVDDVSGDGGRLRLFVGLDVISDSTTGKYYWLFQQPVRSTEDEDFAKSQSTDPDELLANVRQKLVNVDPRLREIVDLTKSQDVRIPAIKFYCIEIESLPSSRITLLGDAAHVMPPCKSCSQQRRTMLGANQYDNQSVEKGACMLFETQSIWESF